MFAIVFICGLIGVGIAAIELILFQQGILVDEYVTRSISIANVMAVTIICWLMVGGVIAAAQR